MNKAEEKKRLTITDSLPGEAGEVQEKEAREDAGENLAQHNLSGDITGSRQRLDNAMNKVQPTAEQVAEDQPLTVQQLDDLGYQARTPKEADLKVTAADKKE